MSRATGSDSARWASTWFAEAAFPAFVHGTSPDLTFTAVIHTGIGF